MGRFYDRAGTQAGRWLPEAVTGKAEGCRVPVPLPEEARSVIGGDGNELIGWADRIVAVLG